MANLAGKSFLITGATSGIGRAILLTCVEQGASLGIACGRDPEKLSSLQVDVASLNNKVRMTTWAGDFIQTPGFDGLMEMISDASFMLDGAVFSAGADKTMPINIPNNLPAINILKEENIFIME